ncbi:MAG TPA: hypothetical protein VK586_02440, partial [Streptosporangiaceae bacterium]|nr:hypothetical protein [Streptosporangiaceae bacterium]
QAGWMSSRAAEAYACDARLTPIVTGHVDPAALARDVLAAVGLPAGGAPGPAPACTAPRRARRR